MTSIIKVNEIQDAGGNTILSSNGTGTFTSNLPSAVNTPAFEASLSSTQAINNASYTKVQFATEIFDTNSAYDNSTNYRFTVPSGQGGKYVVFGAVQSNSANDQYNTSVYIYVNGSVYAGNTINFYNTTGSEASPYIQYIVNLSAGDYLELFGRCDTASGSNVAFYYSSAHSQAKSTYFGAYKLIE